MAQVRSSRLCFRSNQRLHNSIYQKTSGGSSFREKQKKIQHKSIASNVKGDKRAVEIGSFKRDQELDRIHLLDVLHPKARWFNASNFQPLSVKPVSMPKEISLDKPAESSKVSSGRRLHG